jgi:antitoxin component of MazEF toxin-antitoxin module
MSMKAITQVYRGDDLIIPRALLEGLGLQPGDTVVVRPQLSPAPISIEEKERRQKILSRLAEAWEEDELADFELRREEMWKQWPAFKS